ncbi:MAG: RNase adapter RapZ [Burkholderiales bacterium]|nr:MAG: RNase adapter RapZ [Burkholderiales bacterium]
MLITGMSGSGKSVALRALEDAGYYCVDNLPPELLASFIDVERQHKVNRIAIAMDVRSATSLPIVPKQLKALREQGITVKTVFLDATTDTLVHRFSETRRKHPLSSSQTDDQRRALTDAIEMERDLLAELREDSHVIDSSLIRSTQLQSYIKQLVTAPATQLTLVFESFGFKRGIPLDADYVFDVRMLPNPHYEPLLRPLTGRDAPVEEFLKNDPDVRAMFGQVQQFISHWLPKLAQDHRSYVTVAIGCTGGQHRSVFLVEQLAKHFAKEYTTLKRHREMDGGLFAQSTL